MTLTVVAQNAPTPSSVTLHIGVQARRLTGDPITGLRPGDFTLTGSSGKLAVQMTQPSLAEDGNSLPAIRLLLMFSPSSFIARPEQAAALILSSLPAHFGHAQVAVALPDDRTTAYCNTRNDLISALRTLSVHRTAPAQAVMTLGTFPGRRALLYFIGKYNSTPLPERSAAKQAGALIYEIGGDPSQNYIFSGEMTASPAGPVYGANLNGYNPPPGPLFANSGPAVWVPNAAASIRLIHVERTLRNALHDVRNDGRGYYELTLPVPASTTTLALTLHGVSNYQVSAEPFTLDHHQPPLLILGDSH